MKRLALAVGLAFAASSTASAQDAPPPKPGDAPAPAAPGTPASAETPAAPAAPGTPAAAMGDMHDMHGKGGCDHCEKGGHGGMGDCCGDWPKLTISPGLQMWRVVTVDDAGALYGPNVIGLVLKAQMTLSDMMAVHFRGAYGINSTTSPSTMDQDVRAWMAGVGLDMYFALGKRVLWYNTMGLGFEQAWLIQADKTQPKVNNPGAYFITTLDITMFGGVGMWMDWGCGVVGPAFATTSAGDVKTWHINPLGAGGFRFSF